MINPNLIETLARAQRRQLEADLVPVAVRPRGAVPRHRHLRGPALGWLVLPMARLVNFGRGTRPQLG